MHPSQALPPAPNKKKACTAYPNGKPFTFSAALSATEFAVDYLNGIATAGRTLQGNGDILLFTYEPVDASVQDTENPPQNLVMPVQIPANSMVANNPPNPGSLGGPYVYNPGQDTLAKFFINNLGKNGSAAVLTGTDSDKQLPFIADATGNPQVPADARYKFATAQFYAGASYGPLQVTLGKWYGGSGAAFRNNFDLTQQPIWNLNQDWSKAVNLGAQVHTYSLSHGAAQLCGVYDPKGALACNAKNWEDMWTPVLRSYNGQGVSASTYATTIFAVAIHEFDPDFIAGCIKPANCGK